MSRKRGESHLRTLEILAAEFRARKPKRAPNQQRTTEEHRLEALDWALAILWRGYAVGPESPAPADGAAHDPTESR